MEYVFWLFVFVAAEAVKRYWLTAIGLAAVAAAGGLVTFLLLRVSKP